MVKDRMESLLASPTAFYWIAPKVLLTMSVQILVDTSVFSLFKVKNRA